MRALLRRTSVSGSRGRVPRRRPRRSTRSAAPRSRGDRPLELTKTEFDVLELLMVNAGIVLPRDTIYDRIWGFDFETSSRSLDVYIGYLRTKTEAEGEPRLVHTVRGVGYAAPRDHEPALADRRRPRRRSPRSCARSARPRRTSRRRSASQDSIDESMLASASEPIAPTRAAERHSAAQPSGRRPARRVGDSGRERADQGRRRFQRPRAARPSGMFQPATSRAAHQRRRHRAPSCIEGSPKLPVDADRHRVRAVTAARRASQTVSVKGERLPSPHRRRSRRRRVPVRAAASTRSTACSRRCGTRLVSSALVGVGARGARSGGCRRPHRASRSTGCGSTAEGIAAHPGPHHAGPDGRRGRDRQPGAELHDDGRRARRLADASNNGSSATRATSCARRSRACAPTPSSSRAPTSSSPASTRPSSKACSSRSRSSPTSCPSSSSWPTDRSANGEAPGRWCSLTELARSVADARASAGAGARSRSSTTAPTAACSRSRRCSSARSRTWSTTR